MRESLLVFCLICISLSVFSQNLKYLDYDILSNGDTPILLMIEAIARYISGVLGRQDCIEDDSILSGLIEAPQFCAPRSIDQMGVPDVLLSGHHQEIDRWKLKQSLRRTLYFRPDLMNQFSFSETLVKIIDQLILEDTQ